MPAREMSVALPVVRNSDRMEQNEASGMSRTTSDVIFKNRALHASKRSRNILEPSPIIPTVTPQSTARKMSCNIADSMKGFTKFDGTMSTSMSFMDTEPCCAATASGAAICMPGWNR